MTLNRIENRLDQERAALIKGMLARGDSLEDIAVWFGLAVRVIEAVQCGALQPFLAPAPAHALPQRGPYAQAKGVYTALEAVHEAERKLSNLALYARGLIG